jgi:hypothetical protein
MFPKRIGSQTKLRKRSTVRSVTGPSCRVKQVPSAHPRLQLVPDAVLGPGVRVLLGRALEVQALERLGPLADEGEPALGVGVDQLGGARRALAEDPEPRERVLAGELPSLGLRDLLPAGAPRAVRSDEVVALHDLPDSVGR